MRAVPCRVPRFDDLNLASLLWSAGSQVASADRIAVRERERTTTYAELRDRAGASAHTLFTQGVRPGDRIGIFLERNADAIAAYCGVLATGAIAIVINERSFPRQIEHALRHSGASHLVSSAAMLARLPRSLETGARLVQVESMSSGDCEPQPRIAPDLAQIIYTSGSTGLPKGVVFTHDNLRRGASAVVSYLGLDETDHIASLLPFSSVYGLNQLLCALTVRATLVIERSTLPAQIEAALRMADTTVVAAVPPLWLQLLRQTPLADTPLPSLRIAQNAGGHLPIDTVRRLRAAQPHARLFLQYGLTEAFRSTYLPPEEVDAHPDSMGRPVPGADIMILTDELKPCAAGEVGEIVHRGPTVAAGYWADPEGTARVFQSNPSRVPGAPETERVVFTGDLARRDAEGRLYFVGRKDRMIKTLGFRVAPDEVADVLFASGELLEAVVMGEPDTDRGERIVAHVVLAADGSLERLERFCRAELPRYMQPQRFEVKASLPRLAGGKYDISSLRAGSNGSSTNATASTPQLDALLTLTSEPSPPPPHPAQPSL